MNARQKARPVRRTFYVPEDAGKYVRLSYWGTWDRIIAVDGHSVAVVGLTPVNRAWGRDDQVGQPRCHSTSPEGDLMTEELPEKVEEEVRAHGLGWAIDARPGDLAARFLDGGVADAVLEKALQRAPR